MILEIFDVEHGQCSLLATDTRASILIDCGHNATTGWRPSTYLASYGIDYLDKLIITNADEDHASDLHNLVQTARIDSLVRNPTLKGADVMYLKGQKPGLGISEFAKMTDRYVGAVLNRDFGPVEFLHFWNQYPQDFEDENNLSLVTIIRHQDFSVCFPGDMERAGWLKILHQPSFRQAIANVDVFVASHHGRDSGCCDELFTLTGWTPSLTVISDAGKQHASQETCDWYWRRTRGANVGGRNRRVLTTRTDGRIVISSAGPGQYTVGTSKA